MIEISRIFVQQLEVSCKPLPCYFTAPFGRKPDDDWPMFTTDEQQYFEINLQYKDHPSEAVGSRLYAKECHFWMELMPILNQEGCKLRSIHTMRRLWPRRQRLLVHTHHESRRFKNGTFMHDVLSPMVITLPQNINFCYMSKVLTYSNFHKLIFHNLPWCFRFIFQIVWRKRNLLVFTSHNTGRLLQFSLHSLCYSIRLVKLHDHHDKNIKHSHRAHAKAK